MKASRKIRQRSAKKYAAVCAEFKRLSSIKEHNVTKHSYEWILGTIASKFFISPDYVARIVRDEPKNGYK